MGRVPSPEEDAGVPGFWLRRVCWDNPVAMFGLPETVGGG